MVQKFTPGLLAGGGGRIRADNISNKAGTGAPTFSNGAVVTGVATATSFSGNLTGNVTGDATGLSGTPNLNVGIITASQFVGVPEGTNVLKAMLFA